MIDLAIQLPDDLYAQIVQAVASNSDFDLNKLDGETREQFLKRRVIAFLKDQLWSYVVQQTSLSVDNLFIGVG